MAPTDAIRAGGGEREVTVGGVEREVTGKRLFFLRRLKKFGMDSVILTNFYRCTIDSILTGCITVWNGSCTAKDRKGPTQCGQVCGVHDRQGAPSPAGHLQHTMHQKSWQDP